MSLVTIKSQIYYRGILSRLDYRRQRISPWFNSRQVAIEWLACLNDRDKGLAYLVSANLKRPETRR